MIVFRLYQKFVNFFSHFQSLFIFILRLTWGHQFFKAGYGKLSNLDPVIQFFTNLNIPFPAFSAGLVGTIECVGGILLMVGLVSRLTAFLTSIIMITAYSTAHLHVFSFSLISDPAPFVKEAPFPFLIMSLVVLIFGPGKIALDHWGQKWFKERDF